MSVNNGVKKKLEVEGTNVVCNTVILSYKKLFYVEPKNRESYNADNDNEKEDRNIENSISGNYSFENLWDSHNHDARLYIETLQLNKDSGKSRIDDYKKNTLSSNEEHNEKEEDSRK